MYSSKSENIRYGGSTKGKIDMPHIVKALENYIFDELSWLLKGKKGVVKDFLHLFLQKE